MPLRCAGLRSSVLDRHVGRNRPRIDQWRCRLGLYRLERALVNEEFVEHALDRCLGLIGTGIPLSLCWKPVCTTVMPDFSRKPGADFSQGRIAACRISHGCVNLGTY